MKDSIKLIPSIGKSLEFRKNEKIDSVPTYKVAKKLKTKKHYVEFFTNKCNEYLPPNRDTTARFFK